MFCLQRLMKGLIHCGYSMFIKLKKKYLHLIGNYVVLNTECFQYFYSKISNVTDEETELADKKHCSQGQTRG